MTLYRAGIQTSRALKTTASLPDRTTSVSHFERGNKLINIKRRRTVEHAPSSMFISSSDMVVRQAEGL
jgi:hypothetical protein